MQRRALLIASALALVTLIVYSPVLHFDFLSYDDPEFITANPHVRQGLTPQTVRWALTTPTLANWHPITTISHLLDVQLFGLQAGAHHAVNLWLHIINTLLLFALLRQLTGAQWRSALAAGLFALHPLHVESVAWIAERKDVLCTLFFLLTLMAYTAYTRRRTGGRYALTLLLFAAGLMSKPMLVTVPGVLLLLDFWPLGRMRDRTDLRVLLIEKIPFLLLSIGASIITVIMQHQSGAVAPLEKMGLAMRLANAVVSYIRYLVKTVWPTDLAIFYPYPASWSVPVVIGAMFLLLIITIFALHQSRLRPYITLGWLWYLGTLVPVIGIVQVGEQAMADRYTYIPLIGPFIAIAWAAGDFAIGAKGGRMRGATIAACSVVLLALAILTRVQVSYWRDSETVFAHAAQATPDNWLAYNHLATARAKDNRIDEALDACRRAIQIRPAYAIGHFNLGNTLSRAGDIDAAAAAYTEAIRLRPDFAAAQNNLGALRAGQGDFSAAAAHFAAAVKAQPDSADWRANLGSALLRLGRREEAASQFRQALNLDPQNQKALAGFARLQQSAMQPSP